MVEKYTVLTAHLLTSLFMRETKLSVYMLVLCTLAFIKSKLTKGTRLYSKLAAHWGKDPPYAPDI